MTTTRRPDRNGASRRGRGREVQLLGKIRVGTKLTLLVILPVCCLVVFVVVAAVSDWRSAEHLRDFRAASRLSFAVERLTEDLEGERLAAVLQRREATVARTGRLVQAERVTNRDFARTVTVADRATAVPVDAAGRLDAARRQRQALLSSARALSPEAISGGYSIIIHDLLGTVDALNADAPTDATDRASTAYSAIVQAIAATSREQAEIAILLTPLGTRPRAATLPWATLEGAALDTFRQNAQGPLAANLEAVLFSPAGTAVQQLRDRLTGDAVAVTRQTSLTRWLAASGGRLGGLRAIATGAATSLDAAATRELDSAQTRAIRDLALSLAVLVIVTLLGLVLRRSITRPLRDVSEGARLLSGGELSSDVTYAGRDEIGEVATAFRDLRRTATGLAGEIREMNVAVRENRLDHRSELHGFGGTWGQLLDGMNDTMAAFAELQGQRERAELQTQQIFDLSVELLCIASVVDGRFRRINPAFERTLGYPSEVLMAKPILEFVHPDDRERTRLRMAELATGHEVVRFENRYIRSDGSVCWLQWSSRAVPEQGLVYAAARDVTESRRHVAQQASLRRLATMIAREPEPDGMFRAVCSEALGALDAHGTRLLRYEGDTTTCVIVAECGEFGDGRPRSSAITLDVPVLVEGRRWGTMSAAFGSVHDSAADAEQRLAQFVDLLSIGLANVHARAELAASRARIVVAADDARRRIERDLHDGVQQRLISLSLEARHAEEMAEHDGSAELREVLARVSQHLGDAFDELREIALGIHPAILAHGGLGPAVRALARRSPVPVTTDLEPGLRLPERTEVAAYYVVSEALTNTAKHAHASGAEVSAVLAAGQLELTIRDDGIGGATPERGSGLIGLADRVAALNGTIEVTSPPGEGTTVFVTFPIDGVT